MFITSPSSFDHYEFAALDQFYTPASLAERLVSHCEVPSVRSIADFAAGAGSLLMAALKKWPTAELYANDIDPAALAFSTPEIGHVSNLNFLSDEYSLPEPLVGFDLIILNPPFSRTLAGTGFGEVGCSRALAFVRKALRYLNEGGQVIALLPSIVLTSLQDQATLHTLSAEFDVDVIVSPTRGMFGRVDVSVCALKISRRQMPRNCRPFNPAQPALQELPWDIGRGRVSVARSARIEVPEGGWVHTTSLESNGIARRYILPSHMESQSRCPKGSIILPRVGKFGREKIVLLEPGAAEILSDCVIWIKSPDTYTSRKLYKGLIAGFDRLKLLYCGTGAGFITYQRLNGFLTSV